MKTLIKSVVDPIGFGNFARQCVVEAQMVPERLNFLVNGRPSPSESILLVGSGRSGTTWIANILISASNAQLIFEPLSQRFVSEVRPLMGWRNDWESLVSSQQYFAASYLRYDQEYPGWQDLLERIFYRRVHNYWTDYERTSWFPQRYLLKLIRANMMLGFIYKHFRPKIVYVIRHPCAVVASRLRIPWNASIDDLLGQEELVEEYLRPWLPEIERERNNLAGIHAIWWAVENMIAQKDLAICPNITVRYEALTLYPEENLRSVLNWLDLQPTTLSYVQMHSISRMANKQHYNQFSDMKTRLSSWQTELSEVDQHTVIDWCHRFGMQEYTKQVPLD